MKRFKLKVTSNFYLVLNREALQIIENRPTFRLFEDNCQNFVKYLVNAISPGSFVGETIKATLDRLTTERDEATPLPGAYPVSVITDEEEIGTYYTATKSETCAVHTAFTKGSKISYYSGSKRCLRIG